MAVETQVSTSTTQLELSTEQLECKAASLVRSQANAAAVAAEAASTMVDLTLGTALAFLRTIAPELLQSLSKVLVTSFSNPNDKQ